MRGELKVNKIYTTFDGEQNPFGIGAPTIFVRFQGCHIRCYLSTLGTLCDTPEALNTHAKEDFLGYFRPIDLVSEIYKETKRTGIKKVTITGGDPLHRAKNLLEELFHLLIIADYKITVETSGTISWLPYNVFNAEDKKIHWILDYKAESSGISRKLNKLLDREHLESLTETDYIKFVIHDKIDLDTCYQFVKSLQSYFKPIDKCPKVVVGPYFKGPYHDVVKLFREMERMGFFMFPYVKMNFQVHQLVNEELRLSTGQSYDKTEL